MFFVLTHIILCVVYTVLHHKMTIKQEDTFPAVIVYVLPIFGFLMWGTEKLVGEKEWLAEKSVDTEKLKVTDAKYRRLLTDNSASSTTMVPLEDALVINDTKLRRSLLLDILHKNPEEYLSILERAKASDDVEVTHYATTTLLEIQGQFEKRLQEYQKEYKNGNRDRNFLSEYSACLKQFADSGLIDGSVLVMQQETLLNVLSVMRAQENSKRKDAFLYIETALDLKKYDDAKRVLDELINRRSKSETWNRLAVRYYWETGQTEELDKVLEAIVKSDMYLTKSGKEWFRFWSKGKTYEESKPE